MSAIGLTSTPIDFAVSFIRVSIDARPGLRHQVPPRLTLSISVRLGTSIECWKTVPMPSDSARCGEAIAISAPSTRIEPSSGCCRPESMLTSVDLPAPFSPSSTCTSLGKKSIEMLLLATMPG
ncbi:hypothetical protein D3C71_1608150 [compost metagenome]